MLTANVCRFEAWRLRHSAKLANDPQIKRQLSELAEMYDRLADALEGTENRE
jgi:hypothetical protein